MKHTYQTEPRKHIVAYLKDNSDRAFSIDELINEMADKGITVAKSSAYRIIGKLLEEGEVRKITADDRKEVLYQGVISDRCHHHIHMQCTDCGRFVHLSDEDTHKAEEIMGNSGFLLDPSKTVLYGKCQVCKNR